MKINTMSFFILATTLFFSACSLKDDRLFQHSRESNVSIISDKQYEDELKFEYKIAPNDRLLVTAYVQAANGSQQMASMLASTDTTRQGLESIDTAAGLLVTQKGTIRLPLIGSMKVTGLTEDQASEMLINEYKKFIRNPHVTVEITNQRIIVIGEVNQPGIVPVVNGTMNLIEVISRSGYLTKEAERTNIHVIRGNLRDPDVINYDLTDARTLLSSSLLLKPNDIVYVEARQMDGFNKAFNETVPFLTTVSSILSPFVQWTIISGRTLSGRTNN